MCMQGRLSEVQEQSGLHLMMWSGAVLRTAQEGPHMAVRTGSLRNKVDTGGG